MSQKVVNALVWIKTILEEHDVPYQIVGGLAASIHGGLRSVADIDLYIPGTSAGKVLSQVGEYIDMPLTHYRGAEWDLEYFKLIYQEQEIEIGLSPGTKILNYRSGEWVELVTNFSTSVIGAYEGIEVPTIPIDELISYKTILSRDVDLIDIDELNKFM